MVGTGNAAGGAEPLGRSFGAANCVDGAGVARVGPIPTVFRRGLVDALDMKSVVRVGAQRDEAGDAAVLNLGTRGRHDVDVNGLLPDQAHDHCRHCVKGFDFHLGVAG